MSQIDFHTLKQVVDISAVLDALHWSPSFRNGHDDRGACPICGATAKARAFTVNRLRNCFQCFACKAKGNHLDLFAKTTKLKLYEAAVELCRRVGIEVPYLIAVEQRRGASRSEVRPGNRTDRPNTANAPLKGIQVEVNRFVVIADVDGRRTWRV